MTARLAAALTATLVAGGAMALAFRHCYFLRGDSNGRPLDQWRPLWSFSSWHSALSTAALLFLSVVVVVQ
jgi:hypothetical protein